MTRHQHSDNEASPGRSTAEVFEALVQIESELKISPPIGASEFPLSARFRAVLLVLKASVCPHREVIRARLESEGVELATVIADTLISSLSAIPLPVATVSKRVAVIGLDKFCEQPASLLEELPDHS